MLFLSTGYSITQESYDKSQVNGLSYDATLLKNFNDRWAGFAGYHYTYNNSKNSLFNYNLDDYSRKFETGLSYRIDDKNRIVAGVNYDMEGKILKDVDYFWYHALPVSYALKEAWPDARVTWVVEPPAYPLLVDNPYIDDIILFEKKKFKSLGGFMQNIGPFKARLQQTRYDAALDLQGLFKSAAIAWLSGAPVRLGTCNMLVTPVLRTLRANYPQARISLLADKKLADLVQYNKHIDECLLIDKKGEDDHFGSFLRFILRLRKKHYDLVINLHRNERASALAAFSGAKRIVGYSKPGFSLFFDKVMI